MITTQVPTTLEHELFTLFRHTSATIGRPAAAAGLLDRSMYAILSLLADAGPRRLGQIAAEFHLDPSTVTRQVQTTVAAGLARKQADALDRRATVLSITRAGEAAVRRNRRERERLLEEILADWEPGQRAELERSLGRLNQALGRWLAQD